MDHSVKAAERIAEMIAERLADGTWAAENFPLVRDIMRELKCTSRTVTDAMELLGEQGKVRQVRVAAPGGGRRWLPNDHELADGIEETVVTQLLADIRAGDLPNPLPHETELALRYRAHKQTVRTASTELGRRGVLRRMWTADFSRPAWFVVAAGIPENLMPAIGPKTAAIATDIIRRLPEWVRVQPGSPVERSRLPSLHQLRSDYGTREPTVEYALNIVVGRGFLERIQTPQWDGRGCVYIPTKKALDHVLMRNNAPHEPAGA